MTAEKPAYTLEDDRFIIRGYDRAPAFSSFLPGIAGVRGIPLWVFTCNRGQGINSLGIHHKGNAIMEFNPANTAFENVSLKGWRTFLRLNGRHCEPFSPLTEARRSFEIMSNGLIIREINPEYGFEMEARYFILPTEAIGALVRRVRITNISGQPLALEALDGVPKIIPYGLQLGQVKDMSNLMKSWTDVSNIKRGAPMYKQRASSDDSAEVREITSANFYLGLSRGKIQQVVYDIDCIFGWDNSLLRPRVFEEKGLSGVLMQAQCFYNKVPCGFTPLEASLPPGESLEFDTMLGHAASQALLNGLLPVFMQPDYLDRKEAKARSLIDAFTRDAQTHTGSPVFDRYLRQSYLDNFLRGGYPFVLGEKDHSKVIHLFSRKHGDPERDYNFFTTAGEYYSQGNGNFRDVCQNRRSDVSFNPGIGDFNVWHFLSLIQMDGCNPLEIRPCTFLVGDDEREAALSLISKHLKDDGSLAKLITGAFTPGMVSKVIVSGRLEMIGDEEELVSGLISLSNQQLEAGFGEGFWSDHFAYCLDLIDNYLSVFPDRSGELFFGRQDYRFYDSVASLRPRRDTHVLTPRGVRQYGAVFHDPQKAERPGFDLQGTNWLKDARGDAVSTCLFGKLLCLAANKTALLDPEGCGIEMDGGKPGWCDAMNGLPGLMGSGMPETMELRRLLDKALLICPHEGSLSIPEELADFALALADIKAAGAFECWDAAAALREQFRERVRLQVSGQTRLLPFQQIREILEVYLGRVDAGIDKTLNLGHGVMPTYFTYEALAWDLLRDEQGEQVIAPYGLPAVKVTAFRQHMLPLFLEGPARWLAAARQDEAQRLETMAAALENSGIYDQALRMYRTSESLENLSMEHGRIRAFTPGWLERESVFLHMEYKYFYGLLKAGQFARFYGCVRDALVPFLKPEVYGRSILENSSFIASSANPDLALHGRGFVARLTGSSAEIISIMLHMFIGPKAFDVRDGELIFTFAPVLPDWLFDDEGRASFTLLSKCRVTYDNPQRKSCFGEGKASVRRLACTDLQGHIRTYEGDTLTGEAALALREGRIVSIEALLLCPALGPRQK